MDTKNARKKKTSIKIWIANYGYAYAFISLGELRVETKHNIHQVDSFHGCFVKRNQQSDTRTS